MIQKGTGKLINKNSKNITTDLVLNPVRSPWGLIDWETQKEGTSTEFLMQYINGIQCNGNNQNNNSGATLLTQIRTTQKQAKEIKEITKGQEQTKSQFEEPQHHPHTHNKMVAAGWIKSVELYK